MKKVNGKRKITKKIQELQNNKQEHKDLNYIFNQLNELQRTSYIYACSLIQTTYWYLFKRNIFIEQINHWFLTNYVINYFDNENNDISLYFEDIAEKYFLKNGLSYKTIKNFILNKLSRIYKKDFKNVEEAISYILNKDLKDKDFNKISKFVYGK